MADLFISYSRQDRPLVEKLASALRAEGFSIWWDDDIRTGAEFARDIEEELDQAGAVIACWSETAVQSRWVRDEASSGADAGKLVSITLDGNLPPLGFRQFHCTDLGGWKGRPDHPEYRRLVEAVRALLEGEAAPMRSSAKTRPRNPRRAWWLAASLAVAAGGLMVAWPSLSDSIATERAGEEAIAPPRIAVASIATDDPSLASMARGLAEEVATGLSRFDHLEVAAGGEDGGEDFRLEQTLRREGEGLRLSTRLIDVASGKQVWGKQYDRAMDGSLLGLQDDLKAHVVAAVGDPMGAMMQTLYARLAERDPAALTPYEAVLAFNIYHRRVSEADHARTRDLLKKAVEQAPNDAEAWAALALMTIEEVKHDYNRRPDAARRALEAANRAVKLDPNSALAHAHLAEVHYFSGNLGGFRSAAERALELNPYNSASLAMLGILVGYGGDWEKGRQWTDRAMQLNPDHPGWYRFTHFFDAYLSGRYEEALAIAERVNMPDYFADPYTRAMALVRLGRMEEARAAARDFVRLWPGDLATFRDRHLSSWMFAQPELQRRIVADLAAAGVDFPAPETS